MCRYAAIFHDERRHPQEAAPTQRNVLVISTSKLTSLMQDTTTNDSQTYQKQQVVECVLVPHLEASMWVSTHSMVLHTYIPSPPPSSHTITSMNNCNDKKLHNEQTSSARYACNPLHTRIHPLRYPLVCPTHPSPIPLTPPHQAAPPPPIIDPEAQQQAAHLREKAKQHALLQSDAARVMDSIVQASIAAQARLQQAEARRKVQEEARRVQQQEEKQCRGIIDTDAAQVCGGGGGWWVRLVWEEREIRV